MGGERVNISRSNYDKPFRCPVDTGPALNWPKDWYDCYGRAPDGGLRWEQKVYDRKTGRDWSIDKTRCCGTWVLPFNLRYLEPSWHYHRIKWRIWFWIWSANLKRERAR